MNNQQPTTTTTTHQSSITTQSSVDSIPDPPPPSLELSETQTQLEEEGKTSGDPVENLVRKEVIISSEVTEAEAAEHNINGRERLKRHRLEVAGQVWIPDMWGQEEMLKDWIDCAAFDSCLVHSGIMSARAAMVQEGRRANSGGLRIEHSC